MKISEMSSDRVMDVLAEITPFVSNIVEDEKIMAIFKDKIIINEQNEGEIKEKGFQSGIKIVMKLVPSLFKTHKEDIQNILSIMDNVPLKQIKEEKILVTMGRIKELLEDKEFIDFFRLSNN